MRKRISVLEESPTGRNMMFRDNHTKKIMSTREFADAIDDGKYPNYHNRMIDGRRTPASNPDSSTNNNLN
jgi:hypothetical protein